MSLEEFQVRGKMRTNGDLINIKCDVAPEQSLVCENQEAFQSLETRKFAEKMFEIPSVHSINETANILMAKLSQAAKFKYLDSGSSNRREAPKVLHAKTAPLFQPLPSTSELNLDLAHYHFE